ncbi:MAG: HAMP domain-containing histidine kinase [Pseudobacteriovorax sp.]|nr:HAMP domain-containing histidine kinase [Pseudobacteriovorax sp.]
MNAWSIKNSIDTCSVMIFAIDKEGVLTALGGALSQQIGMDDSQIGMSPFKVSHFPCRRSHFKRALTGKPLSINSTINERSYETELKPNIDQDTGDILGVTGMTLDVTKNLQVQQFLDEERHKIFATQRLNSLATVTNGIAHEINNPLAIISGYAEQLRDLCERNPSKIPLKRVIFVSSKIIEACKRCSRIIDSLKDFSRNGSSDPLNFEKVANLVDESLDLCAQRIKTSEILFEKSDIPHDLEIQCRRVQIVQVLFHLLNNAIDASIHADQPTVILAVENQGTHVAISISDNGQGIPGSIKNKIFEPFFTTKEVGSGVGVGLSISKGVIEEHGGQIKLEPTSKHTTFTFNLPKVQEEKNAS